MTNSNAGSKLTPTVNILLEVSGKLEYVADGFDLYT